MEVKREFPEEDFLSVPVVSERLNISKAQAYILVNNGKIPCFLFGGVKRVSRRDLEKFILQSRV